MDLSFYSALYKSRGKASKLVHYKDTEQKAAMSVFLVHYTYNTKERHGSVLLAHYHDYKGKEKASKCPVV